MDNLCHTLAGAVLAETGLKTRTAGGTATLLLASNLPDVDVLVFATNTLPMSFRRGWTHGVLAMALLPLAFAAVMYVAARMRPSRSTRPRANSPPLRFRWLLALSYLGTWLHVFMDFLNSYGVRLLMPFSGRWFYGDALYIVDPVLYVIFGAALVLGRRQAWTAGDGRSMPRVGLAVAATYMLLMLASNAWARETVRSGLVRAGRSPETRFMVTPVFGNPFKREVVIDLGPRYEKGFIWFQPAPHLRPAGYGVDTYANEPFAQQAAQTPVGRAYLRWSRFPFFVVKRTSPMVQVQLNDYRYAGPNGRDTWLSTTVELPAQMAVPPVQ